MRTCGHYMIAMWGRILLVCTAAISVVLNSSEAASFENYGDCGATHENLYKYSAEEDYFGEEIHQTFQITIYFRVYCKSVGLYKDTRAKLYDLVLTETHLGGNIMERGQSNNVHEAVQEFQEKMNGWFHFIQTEDGSIPVTMFSREEDREAVNIKKAVVSAFQANFLGTKVKEEADPQSLHKAEYTYEVSAQDVQDGVIRMHRKITSDDVEGYASHLPKEEVNLNKEEDIVYKGGVLTQAKGKAVFKLMTQENKTPGNDIEEDILEAQNRRKRYYTDSSQDPDAIQTFDPNLKTNHYESEGSYTLELVGQRRLLRQRRSAYGVDLTNAVQNSLLAFINHTRRAMEQMMDLRQELEDINQSLEHLHRNPNNTAIAHKIKTLVKMEAQYGQLPEYSPAIDDVLDYVQKLLGSSNTTDIKMRLLLYFIISPEGSLPSQLALLEGLEKAFNDEEVESVIIYIAMVANPHPQLVAKLETLISSDVHSGDPLLLAYGGIISRASPELQQRMILFITNRLPQAETNSTSLIHHILSLGNAASPKISSFLLEYLDHPEIDIQLTSILAMRFIMSEPSVLNSLMDLLNKTGTNEDHLTMIAKSLMYGSERAKLNNLEIPYSNEFAEALVISALDIENEELHSALISYLQTIKTKSSKDLLQILQFAKAQKFHENYTNMTRFRRGSEWDDIHNTYDLVAPLAERQADVREYQNRKSYIWGKQFGGGDINLQVAAGTFAGVNNEGSYKLYGHIVAKANCYDKTLTVFDFLVLRQKSSTSTVSRLYANLIGQTVKNIQLMQDASVCPASLRAPIFEGKEYEVFDFTYSVFVVVGTLNFNLRATARFTTEMFVSFCDEQGKLRLSAGLKPALTVTVAASGDLEVALVAKAGLTLDAVFNYQLEPEVSSELCYKQSRIRVKNCINVYHQFADNRLELFVWYAWRGRCGWWVCTGSKAFKNRQKIDKLSVSWSLPSTGRLTIWKACDQDFTC